MKKIIDKIKVLYPEIDIKLIKEKEKIVVIYDLKSNEISDNIFKNNIINILLEDNIVNDKTNIVFKEKKSQKDKKGKRKSWKTRFIEEQEKLERLKPNKKDRTFIENLKIRRAKKMIIKDKYKKAKHEYNRNHIVKTFFRYIRNVLAFVFITSFIFFTASFAYVYPKLMDAKAKSTDLELQIKEGTFSSLKNTEIYGKNGEKISEIKKMNFIEVPIDEMPEDVINGYIAVEDRRFKNHWGVDIKAIFRAAKSLIESKLYGDGGIKQGGSTITMQVVKNALIEDNSKTFERKMTEFFLAPAIEKRYSKAQIMNFYLNTIHYGNNTDGLGTAVKYYLGKDVKDLTLAESAMFVGISNRPATYNPKDNIENAYVKRERVLKQMLDQGFITKEEFEEAKKEEIKLNIEQKHLEPEAYYTSYAIHDAAIKLLKKEGFEFKYIFDSKEEEEEYKKHYQDAYFAKSQEIRAGGYQIQTSIDLDKQNKIQKVLDNKLSKYQALQDNGKYAMQGSAVYVNNESGYIEAIIGGRGATDHFNRAFLGIRQPGSVIKPFLVYGPAYNSGLYYPSKIVEDKPIPNGPKNAGNNYRGKITMRESLKRSINTVAYNTTLNMGIKDSLKYLANMEFSHLTYYDTMNKTLSLGGFSLGTNTVEMAKAMSTLFNDGEYSDNGTVKTIKHQRLGELYNEKDIIKRKVFESDTAYMLIDNLSDVSKAGGTGYNLGLSNKKIAIKTGTTNNQIDTWLVGGDVDKSLAVWVGYDQPKNTGGYGSTLAGPIWKDIMNKLGYSNKDIEKPETIKEKYIDKNGNPTTKNTGVKDIFSTILEEQGKKRKEEILFKNKKEEQQNIIDKSYGRLMKIKEYKVTHLSGFNFLKTELSSIEKEMKKINLDEFKKDKDLILAELEEIEKNNKNNYIKFESYLDQEVKVSEQIIKDEKLNNLINELNNLDNFKIKSYSDVTVFEDKVKRVEDLINSISDNTSEYKKKLLFIQESNQSTINNFKDKNKQSQLNKKELEENERIKNKNIQTLNEIKKQINDINKLEEELKLRVEYLNELEAEIKKREQEIENIEERSY